MCNGCKYFIEDTSVNACDCNKADELTEVQLEIYFVNDKDGCPYREEDNTAEDEYFDSLMKARQTMVEKYIIDKTDIHDLLTGKDLSLPQGRARAFCVEIAGKITNGDMIKALFPEIETTEFAMTIHATEKVVCNGVKGGISYDFWKEWWNAPYKTENKN